MVKDRQSGQERWFLSDCPVDKVENDRFSHQHVADNLLAMVRDTQGPSIIGLLGTFGVGKSTIVELLAEKLRGAKDHAVIRISAERHVSTGLHRSMVYAVAEALRDKDLRSEDDITKILARVEETHQSVTADLANIGLLRLVRKERDAIVTAVAVLGGLGILWIAAVFGATGLWAILFGGGARYGHVAATFVSSPLAGVVITIVTVMVALSRLDVLKGVRDALLNPGSVTRSQPRAEAPDELERVFADLVGDRKETLVIAVDDIDRLSAGSVLEALHAIHSFQRACREPRPVFIVSCDERIVREAIADLHPGLASATNEQEAAVRGYLDRLFVQRQLVPPHPPTDLRGYARELLASQPLAGVRLLGDEVGPIVEILIHDRVTDPRHAVRLLNAFFSDYRLATLREAGDSRRALRAGDVTTHPRVMARLAALRMDYADIYDAIAADTDVLPALDRLARGQPPATDDARLLERFIDNDAAAAVTATTPAESAPPLPLQATPEWQDGLSYLSRTVGYVERVESLVPFLNFGQDAIDRRLGSGRSRQVRGWLTNAQTADLRAHFESLGVAPDRAASAEQMRATVDVMTSVLPELSGVELVNAVNTAGELIEQISVELRPNLANQVGRALPAVPQVIFGPQSCATLVIAATDSNARDALFNHLVRTVDDVAKRNAAAIVVFQRRADLTAAGYNSRTIEDFVKNAMVAAGETGAVEVVERWLRLSAFDAEFPDCKWAVAPLAVGSLASVAAAGESEPTDIFVNNAVSLFAQDVTVHTRYALPARAVLDNHGLGGPGGRLATTALRSTGDLAALTAAELIQTLTSNACVDEGTLDDTMEHETARNVIGLLGRLVPLCPNYTLGNETKDSVVTAAATVAGQFATEADDVPEFAVGNGEPPITPVEMRDLAVELFTALIDVHPHLTVPAVTAFVARWRKHRGVDPDAYLWMKPLISHLDLLAEESRTETYTAITETIAGHGRTEAAAGASLPLLGDVLATKYGQMQASAFAQTLIPYLQPGRSDDVMAMAIDALRVLYTIAPDPAGPHAAQAVSSLGNLLAQQSNAVVLGGLTTVPWPHQQFPAVVASLAPYAAQLSDEQSQGLLRQLADARASGTTVPEVQSGIGGVLAAYLHTHTDDAAAGALWQVAPLTFVPFSPRRSAALRIPSGPRLTAIPTAPQRK